MARPRRAARRRLNGRIVASSSLIAATVVASLVVWRMSDSEATVASPSESPSADATAATSAPAPARMPSTSAPSESSSGSASTSATSNSVDWSGTLATCRQAVGARDAVIAAAATGMGHWSAHVQAQTDANAGKLTVKGMKQIWTRTRLLGPEDVARYDDAVDAAPGASQQCATPPDAAPAEVRTALEQCAERMAAQGPVLAASAHGMADWAKHLADMRRSRMYHVHNAQQIWVDTWRAAPPNIRAFGKAQQKFEGVSAC
jgi:hypothetical protein